MPRGDDLVVLAFDHRAQFEQLAESHAAGPERIRRFKGLVAEGARRAAAGRRGAGIIIDDRFGEHLIPTMSELGWWIARPVEKPGSRPLEFEGGASLIAKLRAWPEAHVAKCLVSYHPHDDPPLRERQLSRLRELYQACIATRHEMLLELIPPKNMDRDTDTLAQAMRQVYDAGIRPDWWKLPPAASNEEWFAITETVDRGDPQCRGVLLLGLEASEAVLARGFGIAAPHAICRGFAVGRTIFFHAANAWFQSHFDDSEVIADVAARYARLIALWDASRKAGRAAEVDA